MKYKRILAIRLVDRLLRAKPFYAHVDAIELVSLPAMIKIGASASRSVSAVVLQSPCVRAVESHHVSQRDITHTPSLLPAMICVKMSSGPVPLARLSWKVLLDRALNRPAYCLKTGFIGSKYAIGDIQGTFPITFRRRMPLRTASE